MALAPGVLAVRWPSLLGRRVRLRLRPLRAVSVTEWLVVAGGQHFVVLASPDTTWTTEHTFIVIGSTLAPTHGRTSLPALLVDDGCDA
jgi:streptogramin lyase